MNMINNRRHTVLLLALLLLCIPVDAAHAENTVRLVSTAEQAVTETDAAGNRTVRRVAANKVVPGDEVIYRIEFENTGAEPAENIVIRNPVPEHTLYKAGSATGQETEISYSIDGGAHFDSADGLLVTGTDGTTRPATAADYTTIRWRYMRDLQPGEKSFVEYRVVVR